MNYHLAPKTLIQFAAGASLVVALAACGGSNGAKVGTSSSSTTGTAAVGAPIVSGAVELKCASGATASATTDANGNWSVPLKASDYPCAVRVTGGQANGVALATPLHSVAAAPGTTNITPLTDLIVSVLGAGDPDAWFSSLTSGAIAGAITSSTLSAAQSKLLAALASLPGQPALPSGFDPLTSTFTPTHGNAGDDLLESYASALRAAGLTQSQAALHTAAGEALTQSTFTASAFTTPNLTTINAGLSTNLDGTLAMVIPDPNRGTLTGTANLGSTATAATLVSGGSFSGIASIFGSAFGELCTADTGSQTQHSQYAYASSALTPVTDPTELQNWRFTEYEDCASSGVGVFNSDGSFVFTETGASQSDTPQQNIQQAFTDSGLDLGDTVLRAKAYKYTKDGLTQYVYVLVSTKKGSTTPAINGDTDWVVVGVSQLPT